MCYSFSLTNVFKFHPQLNNLVFSVMLYGDVYALFEKKFYETQT